MNTQESPRVQGGAFRGMLEAMRVERYWSWWRGETAQPLRPLVEWLGRCPLLLVLMMVPVSIVWGAFDELGLPSLFFHDVPRVSFVAAFMAAMLLGQLCFIGYLLDADEPWALAARKGKKRGEPPSIRWYLFRTGTYPLWLVALCVPCLIDRHFDFLYGVLAAVLAVVQLTRGAEWLQHRYEENRRRYHWVRRIEVTLFRRRPTHVVALHVLQAGLLALFALGYVMVAAYVAFSGNPGWVSPAVVICVAVGLCGAVYGAIRFFFPYRHMGALVLVGVLFVLVGRGFSDLSLYDELSLSRPPAYAGESLVSPREARLLEDGAVLEAWLEGMRTKPPPGVTWPTEGETLFASGQEAGRCGPGPKPRLALVATSGGGIRAAAWTAHVLSRLEAGVAGFHRYVRLMTGASGGMVGAGAWVAGLEPEGTPSRMVSLPTMMQQDSLSPTAVALLLPFGESRGRALEASWNKQTGGLLGRSFQELRAGEAEGWLPSLVYSPMLVEDGRRLLVSNLDLTALTLAEASSLVVERNGDEPREGARERLSLSGVQLFQLFPGRQEAFSVAAAARMSASFPYVSPASALPTEPPVRVVDAGYYDNYGVHLAALWLHEHREWVRECTSGVLLIQIRDHLGKGRRTRLQASRGTAEVLGGLTSPVEAVLRARESSMSFRNDELLEWVEGELNAGEPCFFTTAIFEFSETAPLSWALTARDVRQLERAASSPGMQTRVDAVREWLTAGPEAQARARQLGMCPGSRELSP